MVLYRKFKKVPLYMKQFYDETTLDWKWFSLPSFVKKWWLDFDLYRYNLSASKSKKSKKLE